MPLDPRTARKAAALARLRMAGQLKLMDSALESAQFHAEERDGSTAHVHEARRLLKEILGAVEVSGDASPLG